MEEELTGKEIEVPVEIMHEILSRLPVKPLCRFKLVSKAWLSLISHPMFVAKHSKAIENSNDVLFQRRRLLFTDTIDGRLYSLDLDEFLDQNHHALVNNRSNQLVEVDVAAEAVAATELDVDDPFEKLLVTRDAIVSYYLCGNGASFALSCNGLLLAESSVGHYYLVDPVAKRVKKLPKTPKWEWKPMRADLYGIGFDHSTNEYKVVNGQVAPWFAGHGNHGIVFNVYTLKTGSWRKGVRLFPYRHSISPTLGREGVLVNGGIHWLVRRVDEPLDAIICLKLAEDTLVTEIPLPSILSRRNNGMMELGVFRDRLCVTLYSRLMKTETYNEFWFMEEDAVRKYSWTKMRVSVPYRMLSHSGFWRGGYDLMIVDKSTFVMYNFDDEKYWTLAIKGIGKAGSYASGGIYVESLVSVLTQDA